MAPIARKVALLAEASLTPTPTLLAKLAAITTPATLTTRVEVEQPTTSRMIMMMMNLMASGILI
jgi:hypothetical protein